MTPVDTVALQSKSWKNMTLRYPEVHILKSEAYERRPN